LKIKRTVKSKSPSRRTKKAALRSNKPVLPVKKARKAFSRTKKSVEPTLAPAVEFMQPAPQPGEAFSPFSAQITEHTIATAWEVLGDEEFVLDDEIWNTLYNRIKLQLLQASYSFRIESDSATLSPWSVTPMPAFRSNHEPGFLKAGSFTVLRPELPGIVFDLKISASDHALLLHWSLRRKDSAASAGHIALYCNGELVEAVNLNQNRCQLELTREDLGDIAFYFLDAETGRQTKILELSV
jgi:hypothetical protein